VRRKVVRLSTHKGAGKHAHSVRAWALRLGGVVCLLLSVGIVVRYRQHLASSSGGTASSMAPAPTYGAPRSAFDAFFGGNVPYGAGYYWDCVPPTGGSTRPIPPIHVLFNASGQAISITWRGCRSDFHASWRDAATPYLPADAHLLVERSKTRGVTLAVYTSQTVRTETGDDTFTLEGGPGRAFSLTSGNALTR
jgi:hypothetical protein